MNVYKLRDRNTGLYAAGGIDKWTDKGKTWKELGHLKAALTNYLRHRAFLRKQYRRSDLNPNDIPDSWEVVVLVTSENTRSAKALWLEGKS